MNVKVYSDWDKVGFSEEEREEWELVTDSPIEAKKWRDAGFRSKEAQKWKLLGIELPEAKKFRQLNMDVDDVKRWMKGGFKDTEQIIAWNNLGIDLTTADMLVKRGIDAKKAQILLGHGISKSRLYKLARDKKEANIDIIKKLIQSLSELLWDYKNSKLVEEIEELLKKGCKKYRELYNMVMMIEEYKKIGDKRILENMYDRCWDMLEKKI